MISARELVFYIRAEDQASRVVKRAAKNFGSLGNIKSLQNNSAAIQIKNARNIANAQQAIARNLTAIDRAQLAVNRSGATLDKAQKKYFGANANHPALANAQLAYSANVRSLETATRQAGLLEDDLKGVAKAGDKAAAANDRLITSAQIARAENYINALTGVARAARLIGLGVGISLAYAAHQAAQFSTNVTLAASQARPIGAGAGATAQIGTRLQGVVLQQMKQFPATAQDMGNALYDIFSSTNIQGIKQASSFLTTLNKAAVAGGTDLGTMSNAAITLFNNFVVGGKKGGDEFNNLNQALNVFFSAVRFGRMNATQFANSLSYVAGIAKEAGLKFTDVADAMAILTRQTGASRTGQDAQGLARLIQQFANPDFIAGAKKWGIQVIDPTTKKLLPLLKIITEIRDKAKLQGVDTLNFFKTVTAAGGGGAGNKGTIQAQRAFAYLLNNLDQYRKVAGEVNSDNTEFAKSFEALSKSPGVRWQVFINQLKALVILIGTDAIPAFVSLGKYVQKAIDWFNSLSNSTKRTLAIWGVYGSVLTVIGSTFLIVAGSVSKFILTLRLLKLESLAAETGSARIAVGLFGAALITVGILLVKYPHLLHDVTSALGGTKNALTILTAAVVAFKVQAMLGGMTKVAAEAGVAAEEVGLLSKALLVLRAIGPIGIAIGITEFLTHRSQIQSAVGDWLKKRGLPGGTHTITYDNKQTLDYLGSNSFGANQARAQVAATAQAALKGNKSAMKALNQVYGKGWSDQMEQVPKRTEQAIRKAAGTIKTMAVQTKAATAAVKQHSAAWQVLFNKVVALDKVTKAHPLNLDDIKKFLNAEQALQKASTGNQYQAATQYLSALESTWTKADAVVTKHVKNMEKLQKQNISNAKSMIDTLTSGVQSMYDSLNQQAQTLYGTLFQGPIVSGARVQNELQFGGHVTGLDLLKDIKAQNFQFNHVNNQLTKLGRRGAPKALLDQIRALGPDAIPDINQLMGLTPRQFRQYIQAFNQGQKEIKSNTIRQLNDQLKIYESYGKKIAMAIIKGVQSQDQSVQKVLKNTVLNLFPGLAHQAHLSTKPPTPTRLSLPGTLGGEYHTHYHITAPGESIGHTVTAIKHVDFAKRNKHKGNR